MDLVVLLDKSSKRNLHKQLCDAVEDAVCRGLLKPGDPVPSTRELAHLLAISRFTVRRSYDELIKRGLLQTVPGGKTIVNYQSDKSSMSFAPDQYDEDKLSSRSHKSLHLSSFSQQLLFQNEDMVPSKDQSIETNFWAPPNDHVPLATWRQLVLKACKMEDAPSLLALASDRFGYLPLRQALCEYLTRARSLSCKPEHVAIFSASNPLDFILRLVANPGDVAVVENPGYPTARKLFSLHQMKVVGVNVDQDGLIVDDLLKIENVRLVYLTPSHQDPTGAILSLSRRQRLLSWAARHNVILIEDDYDCEFNYDGRSLPSLKALDNSGCVIYWQAFWKVFGDHMKLNFMVLPETLIEPAKSAKLILEKGLPLIEQVALTSFIKDGYLERHLKRTSYARRRQLLIYSLTKHFGSGITVTKVSAGMHLTVRFRSNLADELILKSAAASSLPVVSTRAYYVDTPVAGEFLIPFAQLEEENIEPLVKAFAQGLEQIGDTLGFIHHQTTYQHMT